MQKEIEFHHGALVEEYEVQANNQGYTLGEYAKTAQKLGFGLAINHIHGVLTDAVYDKALKRLQKQLIEHLEPIREA